MMIQKLLGLLLNQAKSKGQHKKELFTAISSYNIDHDSAVVTITFMIGYSLLKYQTC